MRISKIVLVCLMSLVVSTSTFGWNRNQPTQVRFGSQTQGIPGYLNPQTGVFTTRPANASPAITPPPTTPIVFRLIFNFNIEFNDQPSTNTFACDVSISPVGDTSGLFHSEDAVSTSTDGGKTCQVTILAKWDLANASTDSIAIDYTISSIQSVSGTLQSFRTSSHSLPEIPMLTNGQTITEPTITAVI
jgi:hypothetical protein